MLKKEDSTIKEEKNREHVFNISQNFCKMWVGQDVSGVMRSGYDCVEMIFLDSLTPDLHFHLSFM